MKKLFATALVALAGHAAAHVTYRWETIDPGATTAPIVGEIVVSDAAYRAGYVDFFNYPCTGDPECAPPDGNPSSPVRLLAFYIEGLPGAGVYLDYVNTNGNNGDEQPSGVEALLANLLTNGRVFNGGTANILEITGDASGLWTVDIAMSADGDGTAEVVDGWPCWQGGLCGGETGRWVLDRSTIPVPEPSTLALAGLALAGLRVRRRTKIGQ